MTEKTKKEPETKKPAAKTTAKTPAKAPAKAKPAARKASPAKKPAAAPKEAPAPKEKKEEPKREDKPQAEEKPLITSNTDEGGISGLLFSLLLIAVLAGGGYATLPLWSPYVVDYLPELEMGGGAEPPEDLLVDRIGEIEQEIQKVRDSGQGIADLEQERSRLNDSIDNVMTRIDGLEKQIAHVKDMLQATSPPSDAVDTNQSLQRLTNRMNELERSDETVNAVMERLARLEKAMSDSGATASSSAEQLSKTMADISQRIGTLETGAAESSATETEVAERTKAQVRAQSLVLAVGHLRETLRSSAPYTQALDALKALGEGDPDIMRGVEELIPYAETGAPTLNMLRRDFIATSEAIRAAAPEAAAEGAAGLLDKALNRLTSLVSVRKAGSDGSAGGPQGPTEEAMKRLGSGDLAGAIEVIAALYGAEADAARPWLEGARARLTAETSLARLHVFVVSLLAPSDQ